MIICRVRSFREPQSICFRACTLLSLTKHVQHRSIRTSISTNPDCGGKVLTLSYLPWRMHRS